MNKRIKNFDQSDVRISLTLNKIVNFSNLNRSNCIDNQDLKLYAR
jgi:hypothetical protein